MKMKKILTPLIALTLTLTLPISALAANDANVNEQEDAVTAPGHKDAIAGERDGYDAGNGNEQLTGESYGYSEAESFNGTDWTVTDDDDEIDETGTPDAGYKTDINVWARISDASAKIYKIDIAWGSMKFEFNDCSGSWDVLTHTYSGTGGNPHWVNSSADGITGIDEQTGYEVGTNGTNNRVTVTNHSNSAIDAAFEYTMVQSARAAAAGTAATLFNDGGTDVNGVYGGDYGDDTVVDGSYTANAIHDVIGYFYGSNAEAAKGHYAIADTYNSGTPTAVGTWKYDNGGNYATLNNVPTLLGKLNTVDQDNASANATPIITLPTAEAIGLGTDSTDWQDADSYDASELEVKLATWNATEWFQGARSANVYFAFSGQPDKGQGALLSTFTKVGVITVTITPNDEDDYNRQVTP